MPRSSPGTQLRRLLPGRPRFISRASLHDDRPGPAGHGTPAVWRSRSTQRTQSPWPPPPACCRTATAPPSRPESRRPSGHSGACTSPAAPAHRPGNPDRSLDGTALAADPARASQHDHDHDQADARQSGKREQHTRCSPSRGRAASPIRSDPSTESRACADCCGRKSLRHARIGTQSMPSPAR